MPLYRTDYLEHDALHFPDASNIKSGSRSGRATQRVGFCAPWCQAIYNTAKVELIWKACITSRARPQGSARVCVQSTTVNTPTAPSGYFVAAVLDCTANSGMHCKGKLPGGRVMEGSVLILGAEPALYPEW